MIFAVQAIAWLPTSYWLIEHKDELDASCSAFCSALECCHPLLPSLAHIAYPLACSLTITLMLAHLMVKHSLAKVDALSLWSIVTGNLLQEGLGHIRG